MNEENKDWLKAYICITKDGDRDDIQEELYRLLNDHCKRGFCEHREDGDGHEKADIGHYQFWSEGRGHLHVYALVDDSYNGGGVCISILYRPDDYQFGAEIKPAFTPSWLFDFIRKWNMVDNFKGLRSRPQGYKSFRGYLDEPYWPAEQAPFNAEGGKDW